jgi:hypothetical protein
LFVDDVDNTNTEFINAEDRFTYVRDALKTLNKMDFDKLIASVLSFHILPIAPFLQVLACFI